MLDWTLLKIPLTSKNVSYKNCQKLNFLQKTQWATMSIFPSIGTKGLQRLPRFKYCNELKQESRFILGLNTAKNTVISKTASNKSYWELNFLQKTQWAHVSISPRSGARGLQRLSCFKYNNVLKRKSGFALGFNAAENTSHIKNASKAFVWRIFKFL